MIPGFLGANIEGVLRPERRAAVNGNWDALPKSVSDIGHTAEELFCSYFEVQKRVGKEEMAKIPYGAIAMWAMADKLSCGIQQLLAGARKFRVNQISREVFAHAAGAICGMVETEVPPGEDRPLVAASMFGNTTQCVGAARLKTGSGIASRIRTATSLVLMPSG